MVKVEHTFQQPAKSLATRFSVHRLSVPFVIALCAMLGYAGCASMETKSGTPSNAGKVTASTPPKQQIALRQNQQLLPGDRTVIGTVESIHAEQIKVDYEDSLQPRYLPLSVATAKGMELQPGDRVKMVFNEQQVLVDFHPLGHKGDHHTLIMGTVAEQMPVNQDQVTIETEAGQTKSYPLRPLIRSKMAAVPVGVPAVFLVDETDHIVDVTFGDRSALETVKGEYRQLSSSK
ncbi:MAG: hypothetical protein KF876_06405 [Nitrospira sp.]|nr:hypothetical protein [Nitrospira sp.]